MSTSPAELAEVENHEDFPVHVVDNSQADEVEKIMLAMARGGGEVMTAEDFPVEHFFAPGVYVRWLFRKKGTKIVGHAHKHAHLSMVVRGRLRIYSNGKHRDVIAGSKPFLTPAGTRKCTVAIQDTVLITIHATNETDPEKLEDELVVKSPAFIEFEDEQRLKLAKSAKMPQENLVAP